MKLNLFVSLLLCFALRADISLDEAELIAKEAYIFAYPLVLMGITKDTMAQKLPINKLHHMREFPTYSFKEIVRPNVDTLYSVAWLDLSKCPIILTVPNTHGRYYLIELLDAWTNVFESIGKRTTGTKKQKFAIVGPGWNAKLPKNITKIQSPTNMVFLLGRIQTNTEKDYNFVHKIQNGFKLDLFNCKVTPRKKNTAFSLMPPPQQVENMDAIKFFEKFSEELNANPPQKEDNVILESLKKIGIERSKTFDASKFTQDVISALNTGIDQAKKEIIPKSKTSGNTANGWKISTDIGKYGSNYLKRAKIALIGLGANLPEDAIYPTTFIDSDGNQLNGKNKYTIHFEKNNLPPVNAFWSITIYDDKSFLVENPINRYALGDRDNLQFNKDGSLDIYIQHDKPKEKYLSNWLPSPQDDFNLSMRLYWPKEAAINGNWKPPFVIKLN